MSLHPVVEKWFLDLAGSDDESERDLAEAVAQTIDKLVEEGPDLARPPADRVRHAKHHGMKELRPPKVAGQVARILFGFDREHQALLLVAGDKAGRRQSWYRDNIPVADQRWYEWELKGQWSW